MEEGGSGRRSHSRNGKKCTGVAGVSSKQLGEGRVIQRAARASPWWGAEGVEEPLVQLLAALPAPRAAAAGGGGRHGGAWRGSGERGCPRVLGRWRGGPALGAGVARGEADPVAWGAAASAQALPHSVARLALQQQLASMVRTMAAGRLAPRAPAARAAKRCPRLNLSAVADAVVQRGERVDRGVG